MPRVLIVVPGAQHSATMLAEAVAAGASRVRFTEVELRAVADDEVSDGRRTRVLGGVDELRGADAVVFATSSASDADAMRELLGAMERELPPDAFLNTVFALTGSNDAAFLAHIARVAGIIVTEPRVSDDPQRHAESLGERVAKVVEWVRHARSHEQHDQHAHAHSHHHHSH